MSSICKNNCHVRFLFCIAIFLCTILFGCSSTNGVYTIIQEEKTYYIECENQECIFDFSLTNSNEKSISSFEVTLCIFDSDGEPAFFESEITLTFTENIASGEDKYFCVDLSKFLQSSEDSTYVTDYFYVSKIIYEDGSVWQDLLGISNIF